MELTELYIKKGYPYDNFLGKNQFERNYYFITMCSFRAKKGMKFKMDRNVKKQYKKQNIFYFYDKITSDNKKLSEVVQGANIWKVIKIFLKKIQEIYILHRL